MILTRIKTQQPQGQVANLAQTQCAHCPIIDRAVYSNCDSTEIDAIEQVKFYRSYEAGQVIARAGDRMDFVSSVMDGVVSLTQALEDGRTQMVGLLLPPDFLGRPGREHRMSTVTALSDVTLCCIKRTPFAHLVASTPRISARLLEMTLDELDAARLDAGSGV